MSIRKVQTERVLDDITHSLYATGVSPTLNAVFGLVSDYFAKYPIGLPLPLYLDFIRSKQTSDVSKVNLMLAHMTMNLDVLYEVCLDHVDELMLLTASLQADLDRLKARRKRVETLIDDYLLSLYNTDGYYYSISDTFSDTSLSDLSLTSAFVDTVSGVVTLPTISSATRRVSPDLIGTPSISVTVDNTVSQFIQVAPFSSALDGMTNSVWEIQVETTAPAEVIVTLTIPLTTPSQISRIDFDPYGVSPVQIILNTGSLDNAGAIKYSGFGSMISTGLDRFSFIDALREMSSVQFTLRKTKYDYTNTTNGTVKYRYVFGAKDISLTEQVYDSEARFVSSSLSLIQELQSDMVIDAVSLVVDSELVADTDIIYFIAQEPSNANPELDDFIWKQIQPIGQGNNNIIHFDGANVITSYFKDNPSAGDTQLIPLDDTNTDITKRNPSPVIIPGVDTYRIGQFLDDYITNTLSLDEGVNSTRVFYTNYDVAAVQSLDFWTAIVASTSPSVVYGRIDTGKGFFYGGDVGENGKSIYVETYLDSPNDHELILANLRKADSNSQTWSIRAFLNGREVAWLPGRNTSTDPSTTGPAVDTMLVPWSFRQGLNHIALLINIPTPAMANGIVNPYIGIVDLMSGKILSDYGTVKLSTWNYVSFFDLQYNQTGSPYTFSIYNNEIVSRRKPTTNFRISYMKSTANGPQALRFRADLSRSVNNMHVTPKLNSYRLRFSYGNQE